MVIGAHRFSESDSAEWDDFVAHRARNSTFLHSRRFFQHNPANARDDASIVFRAGQRLVGVLPAALVDDEAGSVVLHSHPRATYGGFVVSRDAGVKDVLAMVDGVVARARELGAGAVIVRNPFRIFQAAPSDESDHAMWLRGFELHARELEFAIRLRGTTPDEIIATFDGKTRNQVRKAARSGVTVDESDAFEQFWEVLETNLRERHGSEPTHRLDQFLTLRRLVGEDAVRLFAAWHEGRLVAGCVVFVVNDRALHAQYIASRSDALHLCPVNAVIHHVASWGAARGAEYFNLGMSTEDRGRRINAGLAAFKEGFGAHGVLRETMRLTLPPL